MTNAQDRDAELFKSLRQHFQQCAMLRQEPIQDDIFAMLRAHGWRSRDEMLSDEAIDRACTQYRQVYHVSAMNFPEQMKAAIAAAMGGEGKPQ